MSQVWDTPLPHTEKLVLLALADNANDEGACWPVLATLCTKTSLSERTVRNCIRTLEHCQCLTIEQRPGRGHLYIVHPKTYRDPDDSTPAPDAGVPRQTVPPSQGNDPGTDCRPPRQTVPPTPAPDAGDPGKPCRPYRTISEPSLNHQGTVIRNARARAGTIAVANDAADLAARRALFDRLRSIYPKGIYRESEWLLVERLIGQHLDDGQEPARMESGTQGYARQCDAKGSTGTQYVLSPVKFFARDPLKAPLFLEPFPLPAAKAEQRLARNVEAVEQARRELFGSKS